jgi:hypothetical protein
MKDNIENDIGQIEDMLDVSGQEWASGSVLYGCNE